MKTDGTSGCYLVERFGRRRVVEADDGERALNGLEVLGVGGVQAAQVLVQLPRGKQTHIHGQSTAMASLTTIHVGCWPCPFSVGPPRISLTGLLWDSVLSRTTSHTLLPPPPLHPLFSWNSNLNSSHLGPRGALL